MRKILVIIILTLGMFGCKDQENVFPDYPLQAVYFPIQLPVRTLSMGEDRIDNTLDREHKFDIGVCIGGMYENRKDWTVDYVVDPSLTDSVYTDKGEKILPLPESYYSLSPVNTVIIPKGSFNGLIRVELTDQFFNDPVSLTGRYVIPLRITGTSADSVLSGAPAGPGEADRRIPGDWKAGKAPKDWVLYGIKYINAYQGSYLHRCTDFISSGGNPVDTVFFRQTNIVNDKVVTLKTIDLLTSYTSFVGIKSSKTGRYSMELSFENPLGASGHVTISPREGSKYSVTGEGEYIDKENSQEVWSELKWQCMYLKYSYNDGSRDHLVYDTLVFRDRGIKFELNTIVVKH